MTSEGLILFFSWVRDWIICKVRLYPQHSAVTNLLVTENKKSTNYGRGKATIYISYLWKYDLQIYNFNRSLVYNLHRFGSKKVVYNLQYFGPNCLQSTSKFRAKSTIYIITSPPPTNLKYRTSQFITNIYIKIYIKYISVFSEKRGDKMWRFSTFVLFCLTKRAIGTIIDAVAEWTLSNRRCDRTTILNVTTRNPIPSKWVHINKLRTFSKRWRRKF